MHEIGKSGEFSVRLFGPLLKSGLSLIGNILKPLAKSVLIPLGLTAAVSATDAAIHKNMFESDVATLIMSNEKMIDIIKIVNSLEDSGLLIKSNSETIKSKAEEKKGLFLSMLLGTCIASLLENLLTGKGTNRAGKGTVRASHDFWCRVIL